MKKYITNNLQEWYEIPHDKPENLFSIAECVKYLLNKYKYIFKNMEVILHP